MKKTLKDLALALLNATLLLIALCLFLAWQLASTVEGLATNFARNLAIVAPLTNEIETMRGEVAGLRSDLSDLASQAGEAGADRMSQVNERVAQIDARLRAAGDKMRGLAEAPQELADHAIEKAADEAVRGLQNLRGCSPASSG